ncbi:MAG: DUF4837 family protein [Rhodothermales bacterium]
MTFTLSPRRGAWPLAAVLLVLGSTGCSPNDDYRPAAVGREASITIVIDSSQWRGEVGEALRDQLGAPIRTLPGAPEASFELQAIAINGPITQEQIRRQKNLIFVSPLSDSTAEARFMRDRLDSEARQAIESGGAAVVARPDLWRRSQMVVYVTASNPDVLAETINSRGSDLRYAFNDITRERVEEDMFERGRQFDIEERLMERHGFAVNAQHDYFIATDTTVGKTGFVWLRRVPSSDSWRSLFVYYEENADPSKLTPEWIYQTRDSLAREYITGTVGGFPEIDQRRPLETENIDFLGRYGFETRGLWDMVSYNDSTGARVQYGDAGPLLIYTFYDQPTGRLYLIDGMVFAPGYEKREFLRHLEVIAHTFRTQQAEETSEEVAAG